MLSLAQVICFAYMRALLLVAIFGYVFLRTAVAQSCPRENPNGPSIESTSQSLTGKIVYHDELRQWFGLQLDAPVCGLKEIQLVQDELSKEPPPLGTFRDCRAKVSGTLDIPSTGYYSAEIFQNVVKIEPSSGCVPQVPFPDYSKRRPSHSLQSYRVAIAIEYGQSAPIRVTARSGSRSLTPWQVYEHHWLTGGFVFYAYCADGFRASRIRGTPEAKPESFDGYVAMDPESAAEKGVKTVRLAFTCRR